MKSLQSALALLLLAASTTACIAEASDTGSSDSASTESDLTASRRHLTCNLEYERYSPDYATTFAATFDELMSDVKTKGATASDGKYAFQVQVNPDPPYNLPFIVSIRDLTADKNIAYSVLPAPRLGGQFLFEMGARIPAISLPAISLPSISLPSITTDQQYDYARTYCALYLAE